MVWGGKLVVWGGLGCFHGPHKFGMLFYRRPPPLIYSRQKSND